jgi:ArsR family metal-binding transcriptional regulator
MATKEQVNAAMQIVLAIGDTIKELKEVPSGHLYAQLMGKLSLSDYEAIIGVLKRSGKVVEDQSHLLRWVG